MKNLKVKTQNLVKLLDALKDASNLLAPQTDKYGDTYFQQVVDASQVVLKHFKPLMPAVREVLFGQLEDMITFKDTASGTKIKPVKAAKDTILFGLPNCDLDGILYNDEFFAKREFADFYYVNARKKLTIITLACLTPPNENCFCASMGHGPFAEKGFDLQLTDMGDGFFLVNIGSKKGQKIVDDNSSLFEAAGEADLSKWKELKQQAEESTTKKDVNKKKALDNMGRTPLKEQMIIEISDRCISCGACNYTCPTCTCFNVIDHKKDKAGTRKRVLDSCILGGYFRMAGGHNPKEAKEDRTRNRYFCKLLWDKEKLGDSGCVGCGRCLDACPVKVDIKDVIKQLSN
ncbi:MAG: 4Fe-4S dicluster domain-containing protein [Candidatus Margulisbacteria bacterium]|nr:4Fe-4S dicluster domain-containing protein [Candidatus Margulisiibacteriota bacterium]MBU1022034.1 4Fe-4S dicluster domain-containing protein [Candidatus Margulisiibacteriota bacterium]MBU1729629.1 4Fe-4S dicluster domain-containing protein [Candidatus Margulisiibacteriota bacterium]MBU1954949.1 4Fe-4S dicluster domain-containing protein [Candidatus Margulisiibacteriota bacterium]